MKKKAKYAIAGVTELREILNEQRHVCALTGLELTPMNTGFDHIVPLCKGGSSLKDNLQATTKIANAMKGQLDMKEFVNLCRLVVKTVGKKY